jgi:hypothetical protein
MGDPNRVAMKFQMKFNHAYRYRHILKPFKELGLDFERV